MNIRVQFRKVGDAAELDGLRREHLDALHAAQEPLLEVLIPDATCYLIESKHGVCGYFIVHDEDTLIELHLDTAHWVFGEAVFLQILARTPVRRAWVKSFDHLLLSSCIAHQTRLRSLGLLVRDYHPRPLPRIASIRFTSRRARLDDLPRIRQVEQTVFTHPERLRHVIEAGYMRIYEDDDALVGFGIMRPVIPGRPDVDLGIAVDRPFRNKGHAIYILRDMADHCRAHGLNPIAGVSEDNPTSRRMGERIGLIARHRLLELDFA